MSDLVCVGNLTIDESAQPDGTRTEALGGDAVFATLAARLAGGDAEWLAPIGADLPAALSARLAAAGLSLDQPRRDLPTVRNTIHYAADGSRSWDLVHGEAHFDRMSVHPADVPGHVLAARGILVLAMSLRAQLSLVPWLRAHSTAKLYLDLQEDYLAGHETELRALAAECDVFLPSEVEATHLAGTTDPIAAARSFDCPVVVVKLAERGCVVLEHGVVTEVAAEPAEAVDPTGAGDSFCGAFAAVHLATGDAVAAARAAVRVAALAVRGPGVTPLLDAVVAR
ncbi:carbohydrate kinase family protein [Amycolatopsis sp. NPDC049253]|uniref:carbohydrate kinase family protein n=1 Tax=Amycolatopsis sp. NPDC049253 TaxID=3155274 RepID=UPI003437DC94